MRIEIINLNFYDMEKIKILNGTPVTIVRISPFLPLIMRPRTGDYDSEFIKSLIPAEKVGDKYFHLISGKEIVIGEDTLVWNNLTGTVYNLNGGLYLLSRRFSDSKVMLLEIQPREVNNMMIVREMYDNKFREHVFHHISEYEARDRKMWNIE